MSGPDMVSTGVVARRLGVTVNTVKNWIRKGILQGIRLPSGHYRIPLSELERLTAARPLAARPRERRQAWKRYEQWRRRQAAPVVAHQELLRWNDRFLQIAKAHGPIPVETPEAKARRVRSMHEALAALSR